MFAFAVGLLQAALVLLGFVQQHPELPQTSRDQAQQVAQQAITQATQALTSTQSSAVTQSKAGTVTSNAENGYTGTFSATPASGTAPLAVTFSDTILRNTANGGGYIDYGDGMSCNTESSCGMYKQSYASPGSYTAVLYGRMPSIEVARVAIIVDSSEGAGQDVLVPGMTKYTDADFGFSFWYPAGWTVSPSIRTPIMYASQGFVRSFLVSRDSRAFLVSELISRSGISFTAGMWTDKFFFDSTEHAWMHSVDGTVERGSAGANTSYADVTTNSMGGLHIINGQVIPLSADHFVVVEDSSPSSGDPQALIKTIVATDPSVAAPVSVQEQIKTIQVEKDAYARQ